MAAKEKNKIALWMISSSFILGFLDGMFTLNISDDAYAVIGIITAVGFIWACFIERSRN
jgi:hypothetical protein